jgi:hypothetical protein
MNILETIPLRSASLRSARLPGAVIHRNVSERKRIDRMRRFIETRDWDETHLCHPVIDKVCIGVIIFSVVYFCFRPGAYLAEMIFRNYG